MAQHSMSYRKMVLKFLRTYRDEACLWDATHKSYHVKKYRLAAVDKLLAHLRTMEPDAERCDVVKKINCLRTCYRKERKKVLASLQYDNEVYEPRLWYYNLLTFLDEPNPKDVPIDIGDDGTEEQSTDCLSNTDNEEDTSTGLVDAIEYTECKEEFIESESEFSHDGIIQIVPSTSRANAEEVKPKLAVKRSIDDTSLTNNVVNLLNECIKRPKEETRGEEDRHDVYCKSVAMKLRYLDNHQRILAEKLINDVLFEAELGNLNTDFRISRSKSP